MTTSIFDKNIIYDSINLLDNFINSGRQYSLLTEEDKERINANSNHLMISLNNETYNNLTEQDTNEVQSCLNRLYGYING